MLPATRKHAPRWNAYSPDDARDRPVPPVRRTYCNLFLGHRLQREQKLVKTQVGADKEDMGPGPQRRAECRQGRIVWREEGFWTPGTGGMNSALGDVVSNPALKRGAS
jgi:hypothetical protein